VEQIGTAPFNTKVDFVNGEPLGIATIDVIGVLLKPGYWRCEWDDDPIKFTLPGIYFAIDWKHLSVDGPRLTADGGPTIDLGKLHWRAEFDPNPIPAAASLLRGEIRFDKDGAKLCGGHTVAAAVGPLLWAISFGPTIPDCDSIFCKIPRDLLQTVYGLGLLPLSEALNMAAFGAINTVGLFDAGLLNCN
jgi:hypothetical protein